MRSPITFILFLVFFSSATFADVRLPAIFSSHMVLQRHKPIPVWGWADKGERVTVELSGPNISAQIKKVKADKDGKWMIHLDPLEAGGPYQLLVKGKKNSLVLEDVLIGEVWICSGQSNMQWPVEWSADAEEEIAAANYTQIRQFEVPRVISMTPQEGLSGGSWQTATPEYVGKFTAVGYFFGRALYKKLG
ncbi:MAG: sialate O-acetylesterase, partial [Chitinophagaceae bacterium]|nr:sialate O-acetylesterase [Chitinophagaceae bacterium]